MLTVKFVEGESIEGKKRKHYHVTVYDGEAILAQLEFNHNPATGWRGLIGSVAQRLHRQAEGVKGGAIEPITGELPLFDAIDCVKP